MDSYTILVNRLNSEYLNRYSQEAVSDVEKLNTEELIQLINEIPSEKIRPTLLKISTDVLREAIKQMDEAQSVSLLSDLPSSFTAKILAGIESSQRVGIINKLPKTLKDEIRDILKYPPGTAGYLMDPALVIFRTDMTVQEAINKIRERGKKGIRLLFLVDQEGKLHSLVPLQQLIVADRDEKLADLAKPVPAYVTDMMPQEEIVEKLTEHRLTDIPVVDLHQHLLGIVQHNTIMRVTKEELTKDIQTMVGVSQDERALSKVFFAVRKRLPWLEINLLTAFLAASVVGMFEHVIAQFTALAVLLPVVAGQSGNTGAQALAVTMRGLALKEIRLSHWFSLVFKEIKIAFVTGITVAIPTAIGVYWWSRSLGLVAVISIAMILSMVIAGMSGAAVPLLLRRLNQDPAVASSIILTTITDIAGFFSFLGIATLLSRFL